MRSRCLRTLAWLAGLAAIAVVAQSIVAGQQLRSRGIPAGFPAPIAGANVPALGVNVALQQYDDAELDATLARLSDAGFVWVRQPFYWSQIEADPGRYDWAESDRLVSALSGYPRLHLVAVLEDSPAAPPEDPGRFAAFAGAFASRYGDRVDDYQIWDEPNLASNWGGGPISPPAYADLLARSAIAIRGHDRIAAFPPGPEARILLAGLAPTTETGPTNLSEVRFLDQLYQAGAAPYFDVVAGKPYGFDTGPDDRRAGEDVLNFSRLLLLREVMTANGDGGKAVWASHWGWNALPPGWAGAPSIWGQTDELTQASHTIAALDRARTEWPWAGALILDHYQPQAEPDDARWGFALVGQDDAPRPVFDAVAAWARGLPDAAPAGGYAALNRWAQYDGDWQVGPLGADIGSNGDRASVRFDGTAVALTVRRGPYRAFLYVTVDGSPANGLPRDNEGRAYVVLYDTDHNVATVPLARDLAPGTHTVEVVAERGWNQWALVDWRVGPDPVPNDWMWQLAAAGAAAAVLLVLLMRDVRGLDWGRLAGAYLSWPQWGQVALPIGLVGLLWATAAALLNCQPSGVSPVLATVCLGFAVFVGLLALPTLALVFGLRPEIAIGLAAFSAPLYLVPGDLIYRALSVTEALVVLCGIGLAIRGKLVGSQQGGCRQSEHRVTPLDWSVLGLVLAAIIGTVFAPDLGAALLDLKTVFLLPALLYVLVRVARLSDDGVRWIVAGWVLGAVAVAVIGLVLYALGTRVALAEGGLARLVSVYHSPNSAGLYLGRAWPLLAAGVLWGTRRRYRLLLGLALVPVTAALVLSYSRGALLLGLPVAVLVMGWWAGGRYRWAALALLGIGAVTLIPLLQVPRFASLLDTGQGSTFFRLELWRSSLQMIREHPLLGVGPGQFAAAYRTRYISPGAWSEPNLGHPHTIYLDHWTRVGVLGVAAGVATQWAFWRAMLRSRRADGEAKGGRRALLIGLAGSMAALLAHGLVDNTVFFPDMAMVYFLTLGLAQIIGPTPPQPTPVRGGSASLP